MNIISKEYNGWIYLLVDYVFDSMIYDYDSEHMF